jgi:hypothetical protein
MSKLSKCISVCRSPIRKRAWRSLECAAINAGLAQQVFGAVDGENFALANNESEPSGWDKNYGTEARYQFSFAGFLFDALVIDAGCNELTIVVTLANPDAVSPKSRISPACSGVRLENGYDVVARGWLMRRDDISYEPKTPSDNPPIRVSRLQRIGSFQCRLNLLNRIAGEDCAPNFDYAVEELL